MQWLDSLRATVLNRSKQSAMARSLAGVTSTLLWMVFSSALIILNKDLYVMGFTYPFFVTGMGQLASCLGGYCLVVAGFLPCRPMPSARFCITNLLPIVASSTATMFFGNTAYLYLQVRS